MRKNRAYPMGLKGILISILVNSAFLVGAAVMLAGYFRDAEMQRIVDEGVVVEAEVVDLSYAGSGGIGRRGSLPNWLYRYIDADGVVYESTFVAKDSYGKEDLVGEKMDIYIGISKEGIPMCWLVSMGQDVNAESNLIFMSLFLIPNLIYCVLLTLYLLAFYDKLPSRKKTKSIETEKKGCDDTDKN